MKKLVTLVILGALVAAAVCWWWKRSTAEPPPVVVIASSNVRMSEIFSPTQARARGWNLHETFDVTDSGLIVMQSEGMLFNVVTGTPMLKLPQTDLRDFCAFGEGIVAVCGDRLCGYEEGELVPVVRLPSDAMRLASAGLPDRCFLYQTNASGDIYLFLAGGSYQKVVHVDEPILAVTGSNGRLFFSTWSKIITWQQGEDAAVILDLQQALADAGESGDTPPPLTSLAFDPTTGVLYFSSGEGVFALVEGNVAPVLVGANGDLAYSQKVLFVKDALHGSILALVGTSEAAIAAAAKPAHAP